MIYRFPGGSCLPLCLLLATGCGNKLFDIGGTVTRDGHPLVWKSDNSLLIVTFAPVDRDKDKNVYPGITDRAKGTFVVKGIPPGEYIVSIQQMDPAPGTDLLEYKFELHNSPIRKEVTGNGQIIDIDLPKDLPAGGRQSPRPQSKTQPAK